VQGLHNWVRFQQLEASGEANYLGHWKRVELGGRATGLAFTFTWAGQQKPFGSMLVGTSPEVELALYTTCLLARGETCRARLGGRAVTLTVHTFDRSPVTCHLSPSTGAAGPRWTGLTWPRLCTRLCTALHCLCRPGGVRYIASAFMDW
jgi:hypothetical protein